MSCLTHLKGTSPHPWKVDLSLLQVQTFLRRLGIAVGDEYWNGLLTLHVRGLVYTTLVSLVPFLAVVFSVLKAFGVQHQIEPFLAQALAPLGSQGEVVTRQLVEFVNDLRVGVLGARSRPKPSRGPRC